MVSSPLWLPVLEEHAEQTAMHWSTSLLRKSSSDSTRERVITYSKLTRNFHGMELGRMPSRPEAVCCRKLYIAGAHPQRTSEGSCTFKKKHEFTPLTTIDTKLGYNVVRSVLPSRMAFKEHPNYAKAQVK